MRTQKIIWKYPFKVEDRFSVEMPKSARILCVQRQLGSELDAAIWAIVDPKEELEQRNFVIHGTGHHIDGEEEVYLNYVGTFQLLNGSFVGHLFEVIQP